MTETRALEVARAYHRSWTLRRWDELAEHVAEDLRVEVPINAYAGRSDFLAAVRLTGELAAGVAMVSELGAATEAVLIYDLTLPLGVLRVAEHFTVRGDKIHVIRQIHDTAALRAAGFERSAP